LIFSLASAALLPSIDAAMRSRKRSIGVCCSMSSMMSMVMPFSGTPWRSS
jgi:hypothetical protein